MAPVDDGDDKHAKEAAIAAFAERFPIDEIAKARLRALSDVSLQRVCTEFNPTPDPNPDFSRRLMGFLKGFLRDNADAAPVPVQEEAAAPRKFVAFNPALGPPPAAAGAALLPALTKALASMVGGGAASGSRAPAVATAAATEPPVPQEDLQGFRLLYPMDQNAWDYLTISPPAVQRRVLNTFRPPETALARGEYSRLVTAHITFCMSRHREHLGRGGGEPSVSVEEARAAILAGDGALLPQREVTEEDLYNFRQSYPMDDRAYDYLRSAPVEVQERVLSTFRVDQAQEDYSRAVTGHIRFCLKRHRETLSAPAGLPAGEDGAVVVAMIADFRRRFPIDERALDYLLQSSAEVKERVLREFRPASCSDGDYSRVVTAFVRKCREEERYRPPAPAPSGPAWGGGFGTSSGSAAAKSRSAIAAAASSVGLGLSREQEAQAQAILERALASARWAPEPTEPTAKRPRLEPYLRPRSSAPRPPLTPVLPSGVTVRGPRPASLKPLQTPIR